jgi:hypothetical protein
VHPVFPAPFRGGKFLQDSGASRRGNIFAV